MAYSYQSHTSAGTAGPYSFAAIDGYLSIDHIKVYVNNALQSTTLYSVDEINKDITFNTALASGSSVLIKRETPKNLSDRQVVFSSGAVIRPDDLNNAHLQTMFIAQETEDYAIKDPPASQKVENYVLTWDADTSEWISAAQTGGGGGGTISDGTYGDIAVTGSGSTWTVQNSVISTAKMGVDVTAAGKSLLTAADAAAQRTSMQISEAGHTGSYTDLINKPSLSTVAVSGSYGDLISKPVEATTSVSGYMSATDKTKLNSIASGAEVNVQSDWNVINTADDAFIKNKPTVPVNLDDLSDVSSIAPTNGQVLKWNSTSSLWEPAADNTQGGAGTNADTLDSQDGTYYLNRANHTGSQAISTITNLQTTLDGKALSVHSHLLSDITNAGTAAGLNVPSIGNAGSTEVVLGSDTRLTDTRTPTDGTVTTSKIVDSNVTFAKIQNVTSGRILGRATAVDGTIEELRAQNGLIVSPSNGSIEPDYGTTPGKVAEGNHTHSHTDSYVGHIETVANNDYFIDAYVASARTITGFYAVSTSGTCTAVLDNGGAQVVSHPVSSTSGAATGLTNTSVSANTVLKITVSGNSSCTHMRFVIKYTETI